MYTKEQLEVAKAILLNLISEDRELSFTFTGICDNAFNHKLNKKYSFKYYIFPVKNKGHMTSGEYIKFVSRKSLGWEYHTGQWCYPVPDDHSLEEWEGTNLTLRIDLMKYIVGKIDLLLECING